MARIRATRGFNNWLDGLKDLRGRARIQARIQRLAHGNPGSHRALRGGLFELKIDVGPGYRVYFLKQRLGFILLCGGDKRSQAKDVVMARALAGELEV